MPTADQTATQCRLASSKVLDAIDKLEQPKVVRSSGKRAQRVHVFGVCFEQPPKLQLAIYKGHVPVLYSAVATYDNVPTSVVWD